jgi:hypothetical protein
MKFARTVVALLVVVPVLAAAGIAVAGGHGAADAASKATVGFHDVNEAIAAGYSFRLFDLNNLDCIEHATDGGMGVHMVNTSLLDAKIDATTPEALVYEPRPNGTLRLVALEYVVLESAWAGPEPPSLFGRTFDYTPEGNRYGLPAFYALHAWLWKGNPSGFLNPWNPTVDC